MEIDEKETRILLELYSFGGAARWSELKKKLIDTGVMSEATLYLKLKELKNKDRAYVQRCLINDELHWELTSKGVYTALRYWSTREVEKKKSKKELEEWSEAHGFAVTIEELYPEAWWDLIKNIAKTFEVKVIPKDQTEEDFMKNLKSYHDQIKNVVHGFWPPLLHEGLVSIANLLALVIVYRAFLPSPLTGDAYQKLKDFIDSITESFFKSWTETTKETILNNFRYLEALVVLDKAVQEGKIELPAPGTSLSEIIKILQEHKLLTVEEEKD